MDTLLETKREEKNEIQEQLKTVRENLKKKDAQLEVMTEQFNFMKSEKNKEIRALKAEVEDLKQYKWWSAYLILEKNIYICMEKYCFLENNYSNTQNYFRKQKK